MSTSTPGDPLDPAAEPFVSVDRLAEVLGVGRDALYAAIRRGEIPAVRVGRRVVIPTGRFLTAVGMD